MTIRELTLADRDAWEPLWQGYLRFYEEDLADDVSDDVFGRLARREDAMAGWVAEADGVDGLAGLVHVVVHPSTWSVDHVVYLEDLFVAPEARGTGLGRALIEQVYAYAGERGVYWQTQATNTTARALYDRIGRHSGAVIYERP
jgi:GNAT superfamily N-acetyltransferase